jgi:hypothetical protein
MRKKIWITLPLALMVGFSLLALNFSIRKSIIKSHTKVEPAKPSLDSLHDGDLIFQVSVEGQGKAVQLATKSKFTHIGILIKLEAGWYVYEAVQPVCKTPLKAFIAMGDSSYYVIKRLKGSDSLLNMDKIAMMKTYLNSQLGKDYDPYFNWSDTALYCSEYVWKCYRKMGISLCETNLLKTYDLTHPVVKNIMSQRYGKKVPLNEKVVSPGDIYASDLLYKVAEGKDD